MANILTHPACGKSWTQRGNLTGHCSGCCQTFHGLGAFDHHFMRDEETGQPVCHDPAEGRRGKYWLDEDGVWHRGTPMTEEQKAELKAKFAAIAAASDEDSVEDDQEQVDQLDVPQAA